MNTQPSQSVSEAAKSLLGDAQSTYFDPAWIFASLIIGSIGFVLFVYGKKQGRWPQLAVGLLFMVYPYFVTSLSGMVGVGVMLGAGLWFALQLGW